MMLVSQKERILDTDDSEALKSIWAPSRNLPWVPTSSRRILVTCITESMLAAARSCIMRDSRAACTGVPWKRFLSLISRAADQHAAGDERVSELPTIICTRLRRDRDSILCRQGNQFA